MEGFLGKMARSRFDTERANQRMRKKSWVPMLIAFTFFMSSFLPVSTAMAQGGESLARLEPVNGVYFGVSLRWDQDNLLAYRGRLGYGAAVAVRFFCLPLCEGEAVALE